MPDRRRKASVVLDAELVAESEASGENLPARVATALRDELARRRRYRALGAPLDQLDTEEDQSTSPATSKICRG
jgi:antitoxin CcdA